MGVEELRGMVREIVGDGVQLKRLWYGPMYDRNMIITVKGDMDVRMMFKRNDEHGYLYEDGKSNLVQHVSKSGYNLFSTFSHLDSTCSNLALIAL